MHKNNIENLVEITHYLYPERPTMVDFGVLLEDGINSIKLDNKKNNYLITYQFNIDSSRYDELKKQLWDVELHTHRWNWINKKYMTVTLSQKFNTKELSDQSHMYKPFQCLLIEN